MMKIKLSVASLLLVSVASSASALSVGYYGGVNLLYSQLQSGALQTGSVDPHPGLETFALKSNVRLKQSGLGFSANAGVVIPGFKKTTWRFGGEVASLGNFSSKFESAIDYPSDMTPVTNSFEAHSQVVTILATATPSIDVTKKLKVFTSLGLGVASVKSSGRFVIEGVAAPVVEDAAQNNFAWKAAFGASYSLKSRWSLQTDLYYEGLGDQSFGSGYFETSTSAGAAVKKSRLSDYGLSVGLAYTFGSASAKPIKTG